MDQSHESSLSYLTQLCWGVALIVSGLAVFVWGYSLDWHFGGISAYQFFPLLGLIGFSVMWTHYVAGALGRLTNRKAHPDFFRYTGYAVLVAIVLHPGILIYQRFRDGFGLPPKSYETYVAPGMAWLTLLGSVSLFVFLAFELHRWFKDRSWWRYVVATGDLAMLAIFYHALELGTQTHIRWYRAVWYFYGVILVICLVYKYFSLWRQRHMNHIAAA